MKWINFKNLKFCYKNNLFLNTFKGVLQHRRPFYSLNSFPKKIVLYEITFLLLKFLVFFFILQTWLREWLFLFTFSLKFWFLREILAKVNKFFTSSVCYRSKNLARSHSQVEEEYVNLASKRSLKPENELHFQ